MKAFSRKIVVSFSTFLAAFSGQINADCCDCCDSERFWFDADYLYWQIKDSKESVDLVIDQPVADGPFTTVLGGKGKDNKWRSGGKFELGYWFDDCKCFGAEIDYFFLGSKSKNSSVTSDANGSPRLRVPFFNIETGLEDSSALATPGVFFGAANLKLNNRMQGAELNLVAALPSCDCNSNMKFGLLAGFRWWNFDEHLKFFADSPAINPVSVYNYEDKFHTENNFYGGQIGATFDYNYCSFLFNLKGKIALGAMCQESAINGSFTTDEFTGATETFVGGFFAEPSNIGKHKKTSFAWLPQLDVNIGYQFTDCLSVRVGYSVLYVNKVLYASKQIDRNINPSQSANISFNPTPVLTGAASPTAKHKSESLWAQGVNVGLEFQF